MRRTVVHRPIARGPIPVVPAMASMRAVHEEVHASAEQQQQQQGSRPDQMRPVLGNQEEAADAKKAQEHQVGRGSEKAAQTLMLIAVHDPYPLF